VLRGFLKFCILLFVFGMRGDNNNIWNGNCLVGKIKIGRSARSVSTSLIKTRANMLCVPKVMSCALDASRLKSPKIYVLSAAQPLSRINNWMLRYTNCSTGMTCLISHLKKYKAVRKKVRNCKSIQNKSRKLVQMKNDIQWGSVTHSGSSINLMNRLSLGSKLT